MLSIGEIQPGRRLAFSYEETAQAAGISKRMVRRLVKDGRLKAVRIGRAVRIPRHAILQLCGASGEADGRRVFLDEAELDRRILAGDLLKNAANDPAV